MKKKKIIVGFLIAVILVACIGIAIHTKGSDHEHSFGEWETQKPAACESAEVEVRRCGCGEEETREGDPATGHSAASISAKSLLETPMAAMVVTASDLSVTGTCVCGENFAITEGIELEGAALALGENTITVKYGGLSTTLAIQAAKLDLALDGVVSDDTYVSSGSKDSENSGKREMSTDSHQFRTYIRVNISDILNGALFAANRDNAKVQLIVTITGGSVTDESAFTLKAYAPAAGVTDVDFSKLTWNSVDNKEDASGTYKQLHWSNGTELVSGGVGHNIAVEDGRIVVTLAYSQITDFVDENGNILFAFGTNTANLKIASLENKTEAKRPAFKVILNDEHFHVFDQEDAAEKYLYSANCKERAKYYKSCACGTAGTEIFEYGAVSDHTYSALVPKEERTCTEDGMIAHYRCTVCWKYFIEKDGQKVAASVESLKIAAGHNCGQLIARKDATCTEDGIKEHYRCTVCRKYFIEKDGQKVATSEQSLKISAGHSYGKLIAQKDATCTTDGLKEHYQCSRCKKYFVEVDGQKVETTKEALKIPATGHTYTDLIPRKDATCTEDGIKEHYRCTVCWKYFIEKDGQKVAISEQSLKISARHDMVMKWDDTHHWTECAKGCGEKTDSEAHYGGTATDTERAKCEVCGQSYGELKSGVTAYIDPVSEKRTFFR